MTVHRYHWALVGLHRRRIEDLKKLCLAGQEGL